MPRRCRAAWPRCPRHAALLGCRASARQRPADHCRRVRNAVPHRRSRRSWPFRSALPRRVRKQRRGVSFRVERHGSTTPYTSGSALQWRPRDSVRVSAGHIIAPSYAFRRCATAKRCRRDGGAGSSRTTSARSIRAAVHRTAIPVTSSAVNARGRQPIRCLTASAPAVRRGEHPAEESTPVVNRTRSAAV
jgi:hypothetical protein